MKYFLSGTWVNDDTQTTLPLGATLLNDEEWLARNSTPTIKTPAERQAEVTAAKIAQLESSRDAATVSNVTAHGRQWQADERSQKLLSSAITLATVGAPLPPVWRDADNSNMPITTLAELVAIAGAMATQTQAAYSKSWTLKAQVAAALTPEEVDAVVW